MKVLDLFSGLGGWSQAFKDRGHEVVTMDIEQKFKPDICADIMTLKAEDFERFGKFDLILASPPCNCFSVASLYRHWKNGKPTDEKTLKAIELVKHTIRLIEELDPQFYFIENPVGMLRKQTFMNPYARHTITQCQYGRSVMKPTDLWSNKFPQSFIFKKCRPGALCHEKASRSSNRGTQRRHDNSFSMSASSERALIPYGLSLAVCEACEEALK